MNKFVLLLTLLVSVAVMANDVTIVEAGSEWLKASFVNHGEGEDFRIRLQMNLSSRLGLLETATTICFRTDETDTLAVGAKGFGMQFLCALNDCTSNTHLLAVLFASEVKSVEPVVWSGSGMDLSYTNRGVAEADEGVKPDTMYGMFASQLESSNLPGPNEEVYLRCYVNYHGAYSNSNLLTDIQLEANEGQESAWTAISVHLNRPVAPIDNSSSP